MTAPTARCLRCTRKVKVGMDGGGVWRPRPHRARGAACDGQQVDLGTFAEVSAARPGFRPSDFGIPEVRA